MALANDVLKVARSQIGVKESPACSNKVKYNNEYYGRVVSGDNYDWCAVFVWWVFKEAGCSELFFGGKKSAYCPSIADYYIAKGQTVGKNEGKAGDIVLFDFNDNGTSDHIGFIEEKNPDGTYTTIEGNTGGNGQVMRKTRYKSDISWICRPKYNGKTSNVGNIVYLSPSRHGVGNNKCLKSGCYEDKHTRPIAEECAKHLKASGLVPVIADKDKSLKERCKESNALRSVLHVPIHTNASADEDVRYLMLMALKDSGEHLEMMKTVAPFLKEIYPDKKKVVYDARPDLDEISEPNAMTLYAELGFHTNNKDVDKFIHKPEMVGKALAQGICKHLGVKFKEAGKSAASTSTAKKEETAKETDNLKVDGDWGKDTTKKTQKVLGTVIDGIVSKQLISCKKYLPNAMESSWEFVKESQGGSAMIKKVQKLVGAKQDGEAGGETVEKMQKFLKEKGFYTGKIDKSMGEQTVKGWQKYVNSRLEKKS